MSYLDDSFNDHSGSPPTSFRTAPSLPSPYHNGHWPHSADHVYELHRSPTMPEPEHRVVGEMSGMWNGPHVHQCSGSSLNLERQPSVDPNLRLQSKELHPMLLQGMPSYSKPGHDPSSLPSMHKQMPSVSSSGHIGRNPSAGGTFSAASMSSPHSHMSSEAESHAYPPQLGSIPQPQSHCGLNFGESLTKPSSRAPKDPRTVVHTPQTPSRPNGSHPTTQPDKSSCCCTIM